MTTFAPPSFDQLAVMSRAEVLVLHNEIACVLGREQLGPRDVSLPEMARRIELMAREVALIAPLAARLSSAWHSASGRFETAADRATPDTHPDVARAAPPVGAERNPDRLPLAELLERDGSLAAAAARRAEQRRKGGAL